MIRFNISILLLLIFMGSLTSQSTFSIKVDKDKLQVGDHYELELSTKIPINEKVTSVDYSSLFNNENILHSSVDSVFFEPIVETELLDGGVLNFTKEDLLITSEEMEIPLTWSIKVLVLDYGSFLIPVPKIKSSDGRMLTCVNCNEVLISALPPEDVFQGGGDPTQVQNISHIKPIIEERISWRDFVMPFLALLTILGIGGAFFWYYKNKNIDEENIVDDVPNEIIPSHIKAIESLDDLKRKELWQNGQEKSYHSELTYIMRQYLEDRFELNALEMTTREINQELNTMNVPKTLINSLIDILQIADIVKFAKGKAGQEINERFMRESYAFIHQTKNEVML